MPVSIVTILSITTLIHCKQLSRTSSSYRWKKVSGFTYLKGRERRENAKRFYHALGPQMAATARNGPGQSQETGSLSRSLAWVTETQVVEPPSAAFPAALAGSCLRSRTARAWSRALLWDVGIATSILALWDTMPTSRFLFIHNKINIYIKDHFSYMPLKFQNLPCFLLGILAGITCIWLRC